jgi:hypothetical protein
MQSVRSFAGVCLVSLGLVAVGFYVGERNVNAAVHASVMQRFVPLSNGKVLDTKTGAECTPYNPTANSNLPKGFTLDGSCQQLASQ